MFSCAVSVGNSWKNWKTMPTYLPHQRASRFSLILHLATLLAAAYDVARRRAFNSGQGLCDGLEWAAVRRAREGPVGSPGAAGCELGGLRGAGAARDKQAVDFGLEFRAANLVAGRGAGGGLECPALAGVAKRSGREH